MNAQGLRETLTRTLEIEQGRRHVERGQGDRRRLGTCLCGQLLRWHFGRRNEFLPCSQVAAHRGAA